MLERISHCVLASMAVFGALGLSPGAVAAEPPQEHPAMAGEAATPTRTVEGVLSVIWADPAPGKTGPGRVMISLHTAAGGTIVLDPESAQRARPGILQMGGVRVEVRLAEPAASRLKSTGRRAAGAAKVEAVRVLGEAKAKAAEPAADSRALKWAVFGCKFSDSDAEPISEDEIRRLLSDQSGHLGDYWRTVSKGAISLDQTAVVPIWGQLSEPRSAYIDRDDEFMEDGIGRLLGDCVQKYDDLTGFAPGDVDGLLIMMNEPLDCCSYGGYGVFHYEDGTADLLRFGLIHAWGAKASGHIAHEMGHGMGLPHANNSDEDDDPYDNPWDVMSMSSQYGVRAEFGIRPKFLNAYHLDRLGWIAPERRLVVSEEGSTGSIELDSNGAPDGSGYHLIELPLLDGTRYTLEARKRGVARTYEGALAGNAVIVHHVDEWRQEPSWSVDRKVPPADVADNRESMFQPRIQWDTPEGQYTIAVDVATENGYKLRVVKNPPPPSGFISLNQFAASGSWANLQTDGQGFVLTVAPDARESGTGTLFGGWYTYGREGGQRWFTVQGTVTSGQSRATVPVYATRGGRFAGAGAVTTTRVGEVEFEILACDEAVARYSIKDPWSPGSGVQTGTIPLQRLLARQDCSFRGDRPDNEAPVALGGPWANLAHDGQGLVIEISPYSHTLFAGWYTYEDAGSGAGNVWYTLQGDAMHGETRFEDVGIYYTEGGRFDAAGEVVTTLVGEATIEFTSCVEATMKYRFTSGRYKGRSGTLALERLLRPPTGCSPEPRGE